MTKGTISGKKYRVGIVSANWGAIAHLPAWRLLADDVEVTAICTSREQTALKAAQDFQVGRPFWDYEAMCADPDIDVIDAGTNPLLREKICHAAIRNGKHVVNQMPFAIDYAAAKGLYEAQAAAGVQGIGASSLCGLPHLAMMKEILDAGEIGEVYQVHCSWQLSFFLEIMPGFPYTWFGKAGQGVSVTRNHGSHLLNALRQTFGPIAAVSAHIGTQHKLWDVPGEAPMINETDDTSHAHLRFVSGAMGTFITSWTAADSPGFVLDVLGSKGRLRIEAQRYPSIESARLYQAGNSMLMIPDGQNVEIPERHMSVAGQPVGPSEIDMYNGGQRISLARLFERFVRSIDGGPDPLVSFARAAAVQNIIEALYRSSETRGWIDLEQAAMA